MTYMEEEKNLQQKSTTQCPNKQQHILATEHKPVDSLTDKRLYF